MLKSRFGNTIKSSFQGIGAGLRTIKSNVWRFTARVGLMDMEIVNGDNLFWIFPDGTTSTSTRPAKTIAVEGIVTVTCSDWSKSTIQLKANSTGSRIVCNTRDLPRITSHLVINNCPNITGNVADLPRVTNVVNMDSCPGIFGNIADLPRVGAFINIPNCPNIVGSFGTNYSPSCSNITLQNTGQTPTDTDSCIITIANNTTARAGSILKVKANRTSASDSAKTVLVGYGWTITDT